MASEINRRRFLESIALSGADLAVLKKSKLMAEEEAAISLSDAKSQKQQSSHAV